MLEENQTEFSAETEKAEELPEAGEKLPETFLCELSEPIWSVITFEDCAVSSMTYDEARQWADRLFKQNVSGICIVTDEAASRISNQSS